MRIIKCVLIAAALLSACGEDVSTRAVDRDSAEAADSTAPADTAILRPDKSNVRDAQGADAAVALIREYYAAIAAGEYARAYALWENGGKASGQSFEEFRSGFAQTAAVAVEAGAAGRIEGAAGSRYIEVPVTIRARTMQGESQCFVGTYTLRRTEVPGAAAAEREWHIYRAKVNARPAGECG